MYRVDDNERLRPLLQRNELPARRQDLPEVFILNGAIYISKVKRLIATRSFIDQDTVGYAMSRERSIDIDTKEDFLRFERVVSGAVGQ